MRVLKVTFLVFIFIFTSCGARKSVTSPTSEEQSSVQKQEYASLPDFVEIEDEPEISREEFSIIDHAMQFLGTKYKYGGTTPEGMDCSGLVYTAFLAQQIALPRSSRDMALLGEELDLGQVKTGDLLFFKTDRRKKVINHVGLVVELEGDQIFFIHSSTSRGVIVSALNENYWRDHFVMARRIL